jgi:AAA-like domain
MVISTERNLLIDNATISPFNIGLHATLAPFDLKECLRLNARFKKFSGRSLGENDVGRLWALLRGQPYLTHEAIHALVTRRTGSVKRLLETAADDDGPFADHLRSLFKRITVRSDYDLPTIFKQVMRGDLPNDQQAIGRLKAAGLVRIENGKPVPANQLYSRYFGRML